MKTGCWELPVFTKFQFYSQKQSNIPRQNEFTQPTETLYTHDITFLCISHLNFLWGYKTHFWNIRFSSNSQNDVCRCLNAQPHRNLKKKNHGSNWGTRDSINWYIFEIINFRRPFYHPQIESQFRNKKFVTIVVFLTIRFSVHLKKTMVYNIFFPLW